MYAEKTRVPSHQTRMQIEQLLGKHKAKQYGTFVDHAGGRARVQFVLCDRIVRFTIELPSEKSYRVRTNYEQAERQRWRALLLVIKAKLEAVENKIASFEEEFLAHIVMPNDQTVGDLVKPQIAEAYASGRLPASQLLLGAGGN
jgi:hypothetical protein